MGKILYSFGRTFKKPTLFCFIYVYAPSKPVFLGSNMWHKNFKVFFYLWLSCNVCTRLALIALLFWESVLYSPLTVWLSCRSNILSLGNQKNAVFYLMTALNLFLGRTSKIIFHFSNNVRIDAVRTKIRVNSVGSFHLIITIRKCLIKNFFDKTFELYSACCRWTC